MMRDHPYTEGDDNAMTLIMSSLMNYPDWPSY